jgi:dienelactone hydrolase
MKSYSFRIILLVAACIAPIGAFSASVLPGEPVDLMVYLDAGGAPQPITTLADWQIRRRQIVAHVERVMGELPKLRERVPLDLRVVEERRVGTIRLRKINYQSDADDRVPAYLLLPASTRGKPLPGMLCLHQTTDAGKDEPAGVRGDRELAYALELAERGFAAIVPDYPSLGEHNYDFAAHSEYASGSMKAIWDNIRAIDLLESLPEIDKTRIGAIGHSLGGHNAMFTALFEPRIKVIVSSCGFTSFRKDDLPSWTGPRYMPRIASEFGNDPSRVPFDFHEIVAAFAPRPFLACAAERDDDFDASGVRDVLRTAAAVYKLHGVSDRLEAIYPEAPHSFPIAARLRAYEFLSRHLKP